MYTKLTRQASVLELDQKIRNRASKLYQRIAKKSMVVVQDAYLDVDLPLYKKCYAKALKREFTRRLHQCSKSRVLENYLESAGIAPTTLADIRLIKDRIRKSVRIALDLK